VWARQGQKGQANTFFSKVQREIKGESEDAGRRSLKLRQHWWSSEKGRGSLGPSIGQEKEVVPAERKQPF